MTTCEGAFRRGAHQALDFAADIANQSTTIAEARKRLAKAATVARLIREDASHAYPSLLDEVRSRMDKMGDAEIRQCAVCRVPTRFDDEDLARADFHGTSGTLMCEDCRQDCAAEFHDPAAVIGESMASALLF